MFNNWNGQFDSFEDFNNSSIDDYSKTVEIIKFPNRSKKDKKISFIDNNDDKIVEINHTACCFYKLSHNIPHFHSTSNKAVQYQLEDLDESNQQNLDCIKDELIPKPSQYPTYTSKLFDTFNKNIPGLRESKKYFKTPDKTTINYNNLDKIKDVNYEINDGFDNKDDGDDSYIGNYPIPVNSDNVEIIEISQCSNVESEDNLMINKPNNEPSTFDFNSTICTNNDQMTDGCNTDPKTLICNYLQRNNNTNNLSDIVISDNKFNSNNEVDLNNKLLIQNNKNDKSHQLMLLEPINSRNSVKSRYCSTKLVKQRFFLMENSNIESILRDPSDRRIKAVCDRFNCDINIYSKVIRSGFLKNIIVILAPNFDFLRKCVRSLDCTMGWCLTAQLS